jgi:hypothetical protein
MHKKLISADERARRILNNNPTYMPDEPTIVGNPENLKKSDKEIADE